MKILLGVISILWIVEATFLIIYTEGTRKFMEKAVIKMNVKVMAILALLFGLIFIVAAFYIKDMFWLAFILGMIAIMKGVYLFVAPPTQVKALLEWWFHKASGETIRVMGLIAIILGTAILSYLI
ncbi:MAG: hypothetical protein D4R45_00430 [Planctomycetaceae bacterium]|nr:MAG: hypothetical protein D4R45_00430 [Planctomycetaceae bacterium]